MDYGIFTIVKRAYNRINILRKMRFVLNRFTLEKMYFSYIRPILEYGDVIWDNQTQYLINKVENVQIEAMRIVTGGNKLTSIQMLYKETGWETLSERREKHKLTMFYKMVNKETPYYLQNLVPNQIVNLHNHFTRQTQNTSEIRTRTNLYSDYFLPSSIKLWNKLPDQTRNSTSLSIFKSRIKNPNNKCPNFYYTGTRMGQVLHARLRMNSSSLNEHLFKRNRVDSSNCSCGLIESTAHFLLHCKKYDKLRNDIIFLINYPVTLNTDLLLFGSQVLNLDQNKDIFGKVQKFLLKCKRFTR